MEANEEIWQIKLLIDSEKEVHNQLKENLILMNKDILNKKKQQKGANGTHERYS